MKISLALPGEFYYFIVLPDSNKLRLRYLNAHGFILQFQNITPEIELNFCIYIKS